MPKILLGISIVLMLGSATLGFLTKGKITVLNDEKKVALEDKDSALKAKDQALKDKTAADEATAVAKKSSEEALAKVAGLESAKTAADSKVTNLNSQVAELEAKLTAAASTPGTDSTAASGELDSVKSQLAEAVTKQAEAERKSAEAELLVTEMSKKVTVAESESKVYKEDAQRRERQFVAKGLEGQVLAVNQGWNFVVLSIGDRQGLLPNASMVVMRDGEMIAKIKVSSVEPSTAVADIVPGTLARGTRVMPGDRVIYPGS